MNDISLWLLILLNDFFSLLDVTHVYRLNKKWKSLYMQYPKLFRGKVKLHVTYDETVIGRVIACSEDYKPSDNWLNENIVTYQCRGLGPMGFLYYCSELILTYERHQGSPSIPLQDIVHLFPHVTTIQCTYTPYETYKLRPPHGMLPVKVITTMPESMIILLNDPNHFPKLKMLSSEQCISVSRLTALRLTSKNFITHEEAINKIVPELKELKYFEFTFLADKIFDMKKLAPLFHSLSNQLVRLSLVDNYIPSLLSLFKEDKRTTILPSTVELIKYIKQCKILETLAVVTKTSFSSIYRTLFDHENPIPKTLHTIEMGLCRYTELDDYDKSQLPIFNQIKIYIVPYLNRNQAYIIQLQELSIMFPKLEHLIKNGDPIENNRYNKMAIYYFVKGSAHLQYIQWSIDNIIETYQLLPVQEFLTILNAHIYKFRQDDTLSTE